MNDKIGIISVSSAYLSDEYINKHNIKIVNLSVIVDGIDYEENNGLDNDKLFSFMDEGKVVTTSQPAPEKFLNAMNELSDSYSKIICFAVSSGLSGTYNSALIAKDMYEGSSEIVVVDTLTAAMGMRGCIDVVTTSDETDFNLVVNNLKTVINEGKTFLSIDDLATLVNTGRMKASQAFIGNMLRIKPFLTLDILGKVILTEKIRTQKKLIAKFVSVASSYAPTKVYVTYVGSIDNAIELKDTLVASLKNVEVVLCEEIGPVLAVHLGKGGLGVFLMKTPS